MESMDYCRPQTTQHDALWWHDGEPGMRKVQQQNHHLPSILIKSHLITITIFFMSSPAKFCLIGQNTNESGL